MIDGHRHWLLSGGIGSGKSSVRRLLAENGWLTIDADAIGHRVIEPTGPAFRAVAARWPQVIDAGRVDRSALAAIVFRDPDELRALEEVTHPHIFGTIRATIEGFDGSIAVEIPLITETFDRNEWKRMVVDSKDGARMFRLEAKGMDPTEAVARMASQPSRGRWLAAADLVIPNHGDTEVLSRTVQLLVT